MEGLKSKKEKFKPKNGIRPNMALLDRGVRILLALARTTVLEENQIRVFFSLHLLSSI